MVLFNLLYPQFLLLTINSASRCHLKVGISLKPKYTNPEEKRFLSSFQGRVLQCENYYHCHIMAIPAVGNLPHGMIALGKTLQWTYLSITGLNNIFIILSWLIFGTAIKWYSSTSRTFIILTLWKTSSCNSIAEREFCERLHINNIY